MSLTSFLDLKDVSDRLKPLRPNLPRTIDAALRIAPRSNRYALVGTAFDYLLRFEIQRRAPHALASQWVAETAAEMVWRETGAVGVGMNLLEGAAPDQYLPPEEVARRARTIVQKAKTAMAAFCKSVKPNRTMQKTLAAHAIRLAKLDSILRARVLDPQFEHADPEDAQDLVDMLALVPFDKILDNRTLLLNPTFGETSRLVGGADADLISGDRLVDFKVTKKSDLNVKHLDQLLGYFLLARHQRSVDKTFPEIKRLAIYFGRHGYLWELDVTTWTEHPEFSEIESWFFKRAKKEGPSRTRRAGTI